MLWSCWENGDKILHYLASTSVPLWSRCGCLVILLPWEQDTMWSMTYTANYFMLRRQLILNATSCRFFHVKFCPNVNKEGKMRKKLESLHLPACLGAGHACDVTISIYTATGKNFFLHCYIVTNGTGAKPGEKRLLLETVKHFDNQAKRAGPRF